MLFRIVLLRGEEVEVLFINFCFLVVEGYFWGFSFLVILGYFG